MTKKIIKYALIALFCLFFFATISNYKGSNEVNNNNDALVYAEYYLKENLLKDPDSYQRISSYVYTIGAADSLQYCVELKYRAKNSFNGYVVSSAFFEVRPNGVVKYLDLEQ